MHCPTSICLEDMFTFFILIDELIDFSLFFLFLFSMRKKYTVEN